MSGGHLVRLFPSGRRLRYELEQPLSTGIELFLHARFVRRFSVPPQVLHEESLSKCLLSGALIGGRHHRDDTMEGSAGFPEGVEAHDAVDELQFYFHALVATAGH